MKLITDNGPGNVHETAQYCNKFGLAPYVLSIEFNGGYHSTILMRVTNYVDYTIVQAALRREIKAEKEWLK